MKVLTAYPVYLDNKRIAGEKDWLYFDESGKPTSSDEVKIFQNWLNNNYPTWYKKGKLSTKSDGYGAYPMRTATSSAWESYGSAFNKTRLFALGLGKPSTGAVMAGTIVPPTPTEIEEAKKKGLVWDKAKGIFVKAQSLGLLDTLFGGLFGRPKTEETTPVSTDTTQMPVSTPENAKKGMSKTAKIALIGGGVLLVGIIVYAMTRKK